VTPPNGETTDEDPSNRKQNEVVHYRHWLVDRVKGIRRPIDGKYDRPDPYPPSSLCLPSCIILWCPFLLEENCVCTSMGQRGRCDFSWSRNAMMKYALFLNTMCLLTGIFTCLAILDSSFDMLQLASLGEIRLTPEPAFYTSLDIIFKLGLSAITMENPSTGLQEVIRYDEFCDQVDSPSLFGTFLIQLAEKTCVYCEDTRPHMVISLLVAVITIIPSMIAQCTRLYETTDLNCGKCWSVILGVISVAGFFFSWYRFYYRCLPWTFITEGTVGYDRFGQLAEPDSIQEAVIVTFEWKVGYGLVCLYSAFLLKVLSCLSDYCTTTPLLTRNRYEQKVYESKVQKMLNPIPPPPPHSRPTGAVDNDPECARDNSFSEGDDDDDDIDARNVLRVGGQQQKQQRPQPPPPTPPLPPNKNNFIDDNDDDDDNDLDDYLDDDDDDDDDEYEFSYGAADSYGSSSSYNMAMDRR
jgi:hypothetical protein